MKKAKTSKAVKATSTKKVALKKRVLALKKIKGFASNQSARNVAGCHGCYA